MPGEELFAAMQAAREAFLPLLEANTPQFWVNLLDQQVIEAKEHRAAGNLDKVANEIADLFCVGYQALLDLGKDPEPFIVARIRGHIIPKAGFFAERDRAGNGYKPGQAPLETRVAALEETIRVDDEFAERRRMIAARERERHRDLVDEYGLGDK